MQKLSVHTNNVTRDPWIPPAGHGPPAAAWYISCSLVVDTPLHYSLTDQTHASLAGTAQSVQTHSVSSSSKGLRVHLERSTSRDRN